MIDFYVPHDTVTDSNVEKTVRPPTSYQSVLSRVILQCGFEQDGFRAVTCQAYVRIRNLKISRDPVETSGDVNSAPAGFAYRVDCVLDRSRIIRADRNRGI